MDKKREVGRFHENVEPFCLQNRLCKTFQIRISHLIKSNMQIHALHVVPFLRVDLHHFKMFLQNKFIL